MIMIVIMISLSQSPKYLPDIWSDGSCRCSSPEKETASHLAKGRVKKTNHCQTFGLATRRSLSVRQVSWQS